jgi:hypothetical protein
MSKKNLLIICAVTAGLLLLTSASLVFMRTVPESVNPEALVSGCGIIRYKGEQAGMGFFVTAQGAGTNTYFVTAAHNLREIEKREKNLDYDLKVIVRKREANGSAEITLPCNDTTTVFLPWADVAVIALGDRVRNRPDIDIKPILHRLPDATVKMIRPGQPGFLLYHARAKLNMRLGQELFALVSQKCGAEALANDLFPVFYRKGVLAFAKEDPARYEIRQSRGQEPNLLIIDCQSSKGNSGSPVFLSVKDTALGGRVCETPHLIGILVGAVTAKGAPQKFDLALMTDGKEAGRIQGEQAFEENAGLSLVVPIDYLAQWLREKDREH